MHPRLIFAYVWLAKRIRTGSAAILGLLTLVTIVGGVLAFQAEGAHRGDPMSVAEALYSTLGLFAFAGNRFGFPKTDALIAVYFLAPYITASALLETAFRMLQERNSVLLAGMRGHTVVGGAGTLGLLVAQEHERAQVPTVLVNEAVPETADGTSALLVVGDMKRESTLRSARATSAGSVFLTTGDDLVNLEVATRLARGLEGLPPGAGPTIYCHIADGGLRDTLLGPSGPGRVNYFNSYRLSAKALVARMFAAGWLPTIQLAPGVYLGAGAGGFALSSVVSSGSPRLVVVVGLGRFGSAVAEQLAELLPVDAALWVVDNRGPTVDAAVGRIQHRGGVRGWAADVTDPEWKRAVDEYGKDALVFLCTDHDRENLRVAMSLARSARTVVRMFDQPFGERFTPAGGQSFELDVAGFRGLFHDAFPMLAHQYDVDGPAGRMPRIRTCLRLKDDGERWYLVWLSEPEQRAASDQPRRDAVQVAGLGEVGASVPAGWWLVRSGVLDRLRVSAGR
jgi:Trk K+ transport system NAD-binding subunit